MSSNIQPNRSRSPSPDRKEPMQSPNNQERSSRIAQEALRRRQSEGADPLGDNVEEIHIRPLSLEEVMNLEEEQIERLSAEQLTEVDAFLTDHSDQLFDMIRNHTEEIADIWSIRLYALRANEFIARDPAHVMVISSIIDSVTRHNLSEQSRKHFEELARQDEALARQDEALARQDEALDKMEANIAAIRARRAAARERQQAQEEQDIPRPVEDPYAEPLPLPQPQRESTCNWNVCLIVAGIVGALTLTYRWFRGRGNTPRMDKHEKL